MSKAQIILLGRSTDSKLTTNLPPIARRLRAQSQRPRHAHSVTRLAGTARIYTARIASAHALRQVTFTR
jgi:hypothetical protein